MWVKDFIEYEISEKPSGILFLDSSIRQKKDIFAIMVIVFSTSIVVILTAKLEIIPQWINFMNRNILTRIALYPIAISCVLLIMGVLFRTILWLKYRPLTENDLGIYSEWPSISVVMPSYNESEMIERAIDSIFMADYPKDRIEVIVIDDGSSDDTYEKLLKYKQKFNDSLKIIKFKNNLGKRKALYSGIKIAKGEIVVTVDSDSIIDKRALKNIVLPLILDSRVGAVAGRVGVLNEKENILTRMLSVNYSLSFDFGRAYQSVYGGVTVCPGALTAYDKKKIKPILKDWANQVFLGKACTHGEDKHITNLILKNGYLTRYQSNALIYTRVPSNFIQLQKMYIRWTRSSLRESIIYLRYLLTDFRNKNRFVYICDFILTNIIYPFHMFLSAILIYSIFSEPIFGLRQMIFFICISLLLSLHYLCSNRNINFIFGIPYNLMVLLCLWWIYPYCLLTMNEPSWLTR